MPAYKLINCILPADNQEDILANLIGYVKEKEKKDPASRLLITLLSPASYSQKKPFPIIS